MWGRMATIVLSSSCTLTHLTFLITLCRLCPYLHFMDGVLCGSHPLNFSRHCKSFSEAMAPVHLCTNGVCFPHPCKLLGSALSICCPSREITPCSSTMCWMDYLSAWFVNLYCIKLLYICCCHFSITSL